MTNLFFFLHKSSIDFSRFDMHQSKVLIFYGIGFHMQMILCKSGMTQRFDIVSRIQTVLHKFGFYRGAR